MLAHAGLQDDVSVSTIRARCVGRCHGEAVLRGQPVKLAAMADAIDRGRESFRRRAWGDAFAQLSVAEGDSHLELEDLVHCNCARNRSWRLRYRLSWAPAAWSPSLVVAILRDAQILGAAAVEEAPPEGGAVRRRRQPPDLQTHRGRGSTHRTRYRRRTTDGDPWSGTASEAPTGRAEFVGVRPTRRILGLQGPGCRGGVRTGRPRPHSQICHECGWVDKRNRRSRSKFECGRFSPIVRVCSSTRSRGAASTRTPFSRPRVLQIDTFAPRPSTVPGICHDKQRASNGCAASAWKPIGLPETAFRRGDPGGPWLPESMLARSVA